jgi:lipoprotein-anchoring transpeptidase ErfK/SrfK
MFRPIVAFFGLILLTPAVRGGTQLEIPDRVIVSVQEQKLVLVQNGARVATYPVSTSKFGLGDRRGSMATPLGFLQVAKKIGDHAPPGAVFRKRRFTGEILPPNAPGRDPIVTRIMWLRGLEPWNARAFKRCIYIHGTPEEKLIGRPVSYGCIRMKSGDVTALYSQLQLGALVQIVPDKLPKLPKGRARGILPAAPSSVVADQMASDATRKSIAPGSKRSTVSARPVHSGRT